MEERRIFLGIQIPQEIKSEIFAWKQNHLSLPVRWIEEENLHITLLPPWYAKNIHNIHDEIERAVGKYESFSASLDSISLGTNLIWATGQPSNTVLRLKKDLEEILDQKSDHRIWNMHITLARFKEKDLPGFKEEEILWKFDVGSIILFESIKEEGITVYNVIEEYMLH